MGLTVVIVPMKPLGARGVASRWLAEEKSGVFIGELPASGLGRMRQQLARYPTVRIWPTDEEVLKNEIDNKSK